nr:mucin-3A-like isoform X3 [Dermacentor andersoni]
MKTRAFSFLIFFIATHGMLNTKATSQANFTGIATTQPDTNVTSTFNTTEIVQGSRPSNNETTTECPTQPANSTETTVSTTESGHNTNSSIYETVVGNGTTPAEMNNATVLNKTEMVQNSSTSNNKTSTEESPTEALSSTQTTVITTVIVQNSTASINTTSTEESTTAALSSTQTPVTTTGATGQNSSICRLDPEKGRCRGRFESWYFNYNTSICALFIYGGCEGNDNRFDNCTQCMERCNNGPNITDICIKLEKQADEYYSYEIGTSSENTTVPGLGDYEYPEEGQ